MPPSERPRSHYVWSNINGHCTQNIHDVSVVDVSADLGSLSLGLNGVFETRPVTPRKPGWLTAPTLEQYAIFTSEPCNPDSIVHFRQWADVLGLDLDEGDD